MEHHVLVIIHYSEIIPHIILTKRSSNLRSHANEISFPGGKYANEDNSLIETAIRETKEEIGIDIMREISLEGLQGLRP